MNLHNIKL